MFAKVDCLSIQISVQGKICCVVSGEDRHKGEWGKLLRASPERWATTGLSWADASHYEQMNVNLREAAMWIADHLLRENSVQGRAWLLHKAHRVYARSFVAEMGFVKEQRRRMATLGDVEGVCILAVEKMADCLEAGAVMYNDEARRFRDPLLRDWMLNALKFAGVARSKGAVERLAQGPFAGLAKMSFLLTRQDVIVGYEDLPALAGLVQKARELPTDQVVCHENEACIEFYDGYDRLAEIMQKRDREMRSRYC